MKDAIRCIFLAGACATSLASARSPVPLHIINRYRSSAAAVTNHGNASASVCTAPKLTDPNYFAVMDTWGRTSYGTLGLQFIAAFVRNIVFLIYADTGKIDACKQIPGHQYCLLTAKTFDMNFGICVNADCSPDSLFQDPMLTFIQWHVPVATIIGSSPDDYVVYCGSQAQPWTTGTYATLALIVIVAAVCAVATARPIIQKLALRYSKSNRDSDPDAISAEFGSGRTKGHVDVPLGVSLLNAFDLGDGCRRLVAMKGERSGPLAALNGVRVLSMALVVLGHTLIFASPIPGCINILEALLPPVRRRQDGRGAGASCTTHLLPPRSQTGAMSTVAFQIIPSAEFAVDTFFLLSGFLATFSLIKALAPPQARPAHSGSGAPTALERWLPRWVLQEAYAPSRAFKTPVVPALVYFVVHRLWRSEWRARAGRCSFVMMRAPRACVCSVAGVRLLHPRVDVHHAGRI